MPHIIVEHSEDISLDIPEFLQALHMDLSTKDTIDINTIKTRSIPLKHAYVGPAPFEAKMIHIEVKLLPGRPDELKEKMSRGLHEVAQIFVNGQNVNISVEIQELHKESYIQ